MHTKKRMGRRRIKGGAVLCPLPHLALTGSTIWKSPSLSQILQLSWMGAAGSRWLRELTLRGFSTSEHSYWGQGIGGGQQKPLFCWLKRRIQEFFVMCDSVANKTLAVCVVCVCLCVCVCVTTQHVYQK